MNYRDGLWHKHLRSAEASAFLGVMMVFLQRVHNHSVVAYPDHVMFHGASPWQGFSGSGWFIENEYAGMTQTRWGPTTNDSYDAIVIPPKYIVDHLDFLSGLSLPKMCRSTNAFNS
jgi:hypothetical protein